jgi:calcineurin-like phosphoesterase family protein
MYLLTGDWHLDGEPENAYRWEVFDRVQEIIAHHDHTISTLFILGDFVDKKDRHSASFVNRLMTELGALDCRTVILRGNHDTTISPPNFFDFLHDDKTDYITQPTVWGRQHLLLLLPFTLNPKIDWQDLHLADYKALFMHVTYPGAIGENGHALEGTRLPLLRGETKIFSGDVHTPQRFNNFVHVGAPHPVKFGDTYPCRMLMISEDSFEIVEEIQLEPTRKLMLDITDINQLVRVKVRPGDQVKIRFHATADDIARFGEVEQQIAAWAHAHGAKIAATEVDVATGYYQGVDTNQSPAEILKEYAAQEGLSDDLTKVGLDLLKEMTG